MAIDIASEEVAGIIERFLAGSGEPYDWDDFTSIQCKDPFVDSARIRCVAIHDDYPPNRPGWYCSEEGIEALQAIAKSLREHAAESDAE